MLLNILGWGVGGHAKTGQECERYDAADKLSISRQSGDHVSDYNIECSSSPLKSLSYNWLMKDVQIDLRFTMLFGFSLWDLTQPAEYMDDANYGKPEHIISVKYQSSYSSEQQLSNWTVCSYFILPLHVSVYIISSIYASSQMMFEPVADLYTDCHCWDTPTGIPCICLRYWQIFC
jgi:hypothetical protein